MKMKMKVARFLVVAFLMALWVASPSVSATPTYKVYLLFLLGNGVYEKEMDGGLTTVEKVKVTHQAIAALALGQSPDQPLPANHVLALAFDCNSTDVRIVVFNTQTQEVVTEVAQIIQAGGAGAGGKGTFFMAMDVKNTGGVAYRLRDGVLAFSGRFTDDPDGCPATLSAAMSGVLEVVVTDIETMELQVVIPKGKMAIGPHIATIMP